MFNLLRMDLYRMRRSRSMYICLGLLLVTIALSYGLFWLLCTPGGQTIAIQRGMITVEEGQEFISMLEQENTLRIYRDIGQDDGMYSLVLGMWVMLFVCMDYQSGFLKNLMSFHQNRWKYIGSKLITAAIVDIFYLVIQYLFVLLVNGLFGNMVPYAPIGDVLFYISWAWPLTTAFAGLVILICVVTRSVAAGAVSVVLLSSGLVVVPVYQILSLFHMEKWMNNTIYMTLSTGPDRYTSLQDLRVFVVGAVFLVLYMVLSGLVLRKQDI